MPERMVKRSHSRLLQWPAQLPLIRRVCSTQSSEDGRRTVDHHAIGFFHALLPALLISLLLWGLLLLV